MYLVGVVGSSISKDKRCREVIRVVDDWSASVSRFANVGCRDVFNAFKGFETGVQGIAVGLAFGMGEPEKNGMNEHNDS